jgi:hypothetical protein
MNNQKHFRTSAARLFATLLLQASVGTSFAATHYVDVNSTSSTPPYTNWSTAATNIQDAVDAAVAGDEIVVTNGIYASGGRFDPMTGPSLVFVDKPLSLRSVNGSQFTIIEGNGARCVYMTNSASFSGFTLAGGYVEISNSGWLYGDGGGAYGGTLNNCTLIGNQLYVDVDGGSASGGGAAFCTLNNCKLEANLIRAEASTGRLYGGGAYRCTLNNCTLEDNVIYTDFYNSVQAAGGGAAYCSLNNCTLINNQVPSSLYWGAGGAAYCTLNNCIAYSNTVAILGGAQVESDCYFCDVTYCCIAQSAGGVGNITKCAAVRGSGWWQLAAAIQLALHQCRE